ncbi:hypothetical protein D3C87_1031980 [compost metagenome]
MKKLLIPVTIMVMGAGAAFAGQIAKSFAPAQGHRIGGIGEQPCVDVSQTCNTTPGVACLWEEDDATQLYAEGETMCGQELFKP